MRIQITEAKRQVFKNPGISKTYKMPKVNKYIKLRMVVENRSTTRVLMLQDPSQGVTTRQNVSKAPTAIVGEVLQSMHRKRLDHSKNETKYI